LLRAAHISCRPNYILIFLVIQRTNQSFSAYPDGLASIQCALNMRNILIFSIWRLTTGVPPMDVRAVNGIVPGLATEAAEALLNDPNAVALLKAYASIPDEAVKKKLRRLAEEIAAPAKRAAKAHA
jgi:hypothetical protein